MGNTFSNENQIQEYIKKVFISNPAEFPSNGTKDRFDNWLKKSLQNNGRYRIE